MTSEIYDDILKKKLSRRKALSTTAKIGITAVVTGIIGGVAGYYAGLSAAPPAKTVEKTVERTVTVTASPTVTTPPAKPRIVRFAHYWDPAEPHLKATLEWAKPIVKKFEEDYNAKVVWEYYRWDEIDPKMITDLKAGIPHDLTLCSPQYMARHRLEKSLLDLSKYVEAQWSKSEIEDFAWSSVWRWVYPLQIPNGVHTRLVAYRMDMFEEAGLDPKKPPKDLDELIDYAKALTRDTDGDGKIDVWGLAWETGPDRGTIELFFLPLIWHFGGDAWDPDTKKATFAEEPGVEAVRFIWDLYYEHKVVDPATIGLGYSHAIMDTFLAEKVAMAWGFGNYWLKLIQDKGWVENMIPPSGKARAIKVNFFITPTKPQAQFTNCWSYGIHSLSEEPDLAFELMERFLAKENILGNADAGMPARKSHWEELGLAENPVYKVWMEAAAKGRGTPNTAHYGELADTVYAMIVEIITKKLPIKETMKKYQDEWNAKYAGE